jgi:hypothetical protein
MKNEMNKAVEMENSASEVIKNLNAIGTREAKRKASSIGDVLGCWRRGQVGDCLLASSITAGNNYLARR